MFDLDTIIPKNDASFLSPKSSQRTIAPKQQRLMSAALALLLFALGFVLYRDRNFWFPEAQQAQDQAQENSVVASSTSPTKSKHASARNKKAHLHEVVATNSEVPENSGATATATRTVLPPLEVEVIAGNVHRTFRPASNSIQIDLARSANLPQVPSQPSTDAETAASVTTKAAERVDVSAEAPDLVTRTVTPNYPTLARQMKVQGSVILQALIGRDGLIQDLHVVSGPPILANAAQEAVKQWHFRPHYQGTDPVEAQAKITVNFTISTN